VPAPFVSVILPCHNAADCIETMLSSLVAQDFAGPWEVVILDNGSTDDTVAVARRFADRLPLVFAHAAERFSTGYGRNMGVKASRGEHLVFVDADDAVSPGYVTAMSAALERHPFVTSSLDIASLNPVEWVRDAHGPPWQGSDGPLVFFGFLPGAGPNVGFQRALFEALGGAPEDRVADDVTLSWDAQLLGGARIHLVREAVYQYRHRDSLGGLFRQAVNWGRSNPLLYKRFRELGMTRRPVRAALADWRRVARQLAGARDRTALAQGVVRAGLMLGQLRGSIRARTLYL
jgi:glycosyltransferase involved in cell wall biosynthesis